MDDLAVRTVLSGYDPAAKHGLRQLRSLLPAVGQLDAASLATSAGVNLGFDDVEGGVQTRKVVVGDGRPLDKNAPLDRNALLLEDCLGLIFVNFHACPS